MKHSLAFRCVSSVVLSLMILAGCCLPDPVSTTAPTPTRVLLTSMPSRLEQTPLPTRPGSTPPGGQVKGVLLHPTTGEPASGVRLALKPWNSEQENIRQDYPASPPAPVDTDAEGVFVFTDIAPGEYGLAVSIISPARCDPLEGNFFLLRDESGKQRIITVASGALVDLGAFSLAFKLGHMPSFMIGEPSFVNHAPPELETDFSVFDAAGCPLNEYGERHCNPDSPLRHLGCDIIQPYDPLGALEPSYPIVLCSFTLPCNDSEGDYVYRTGDGKYCTGFRYVVAQDDQFVLIRNGDEFRDTFAPIETADEALSYALAVTGLSAYYGLERQAGYEYFVEVVEDTHVDEMGSDGYRVHLFREEGGGWGLTYAVEFRVTPAGYVEQVSLVPVYNDPTDDVYCQD